MSWGVPDLLSGLIVWNRLFLVLFHYFQIRFFTFKMIVKVKQNVRNGNSY